MSYLPWAKNRPYAGGVRYNCMQLKMTVTQENDNTCHVEDAVIGEEECENSAFCPICSIRKPVMKIFVRGLCKQSLFNTVYMYNIDREGDILYLGEKSASIAYDMTAQQWVWYDTKNNISIATSSSAYASLLIGVHEVNFSGVIDDKCQNDGVIRRLKFTTCTSGQFTCSNGQCVGIEERCDQTVHCDDKYDEEDCQIIHMKTSYNNKIVPYLYKNTSDM